MAAISSLEKMITVGGWGGLGREIEGRGKRVVGIDIRIQTSLRKRNKREIRVEGGEGIEKGGGGRENSFANCKCS